MVEKLKSTWCCPTGDVVLNLRTSSTLAAGYNVIFVQWVWVIETWLLAVPEHEIQRANALANLMATEFIPHLSKPLTVKFNLVAFNGIGLHAEIGAGLGVG